MDNRANIKINFRIYGQSFETEMSINYFNNGDWNDDRILEWFKECYNKAYLKYELSAFDND